MRGDLGSGARGSDLGAMNRFKMSLRNNFEKGDLNVPGNTNIVFSSNTNIALFFRQLLKCIMTTHGRLGNDGTSASSTAVHSKPSSGRTLFVLRRSLRDTMNGAPEVEWILNVDSTLNVDLHHLTSRVSMIGDETDPRLNGDQTKIQGRTKVQEWSAMFHLVILYLLRSSPVGDFVSRTNLDNTHRTNI